MKLKSILTSDVVDDLDRLGAKYPSLRQDFASLVSELVVNPEQGDNLGGGIRKVRLNIRSKRAGKSGGARVIIYLTLVKGELVFLSIYDKSETAAIPVSELKRLRDEYLKGI